MNHCIVFLDVMPKGQGNKGKSIKKNSSGKGANSGKTPPKPKYWS